MPINLVVDNVVEWASGGQLEKISPEKRMIGWTGSPSDFAYNVWINSIWNEQDKRSNLLAKTMNQLLQTGIPEYNALYNYTKDSIVTFMGRIYRAKQASAGSPPPSGQVSNVEWELLPGQEWLQEQLDLKLNNTDADLQGTPTAPTPQSNAVIKQIVNIQYLEQELQKIQRGDSVIDLTLKDGSKAYPIILAKDNLPTDTLISRDVGMGSSTLGNMRLVIRGVGCGENKKINSYLEVINTNDISGAEIGKFVKKIQCRANNSAIAVWLKGGVKYNISQRNVETKYELVETTKTLEDNWIVAMEEWQSINVLNDGVWSFKGQESQTLDYSSTSDTGSVETCGTIGYSATKQPPLGALIANGSEVSRTTYAKLFNNYSSTSDTGSVETCGTIGYSATKQPPLGALIANGSEVSRTTYAKLFNKIGVWFGVGDGSNTFNLPDLRGVVPRGLDLGRALDSNQLITKAYGGSADRQTMDGLGSYQSDAIRNITGRFGGITYGTTRPISVLGYMSGAFTGGGDLSTRDYVRYQSDAIRNITGRFGGITYGTTRPISVLGYMSGAFTGGGDLSTRDYVSGVSVGTNMVETKVAINANLVVPTATKNQMDNIALLPFIYYI